MKMTYQEQYNSPRKKKLDIQKHDQNFLKFEFLYDFFNTYSFPNWP